VDGACGLGRCMAKRSKPTGAKWWTGSLRVARRWTIRAILGLVGLLLLVVLVYRFVNPPFTPYILSERLRLGGIERNWVPMDGIAPVMVRSAIAAEDANFCRHWGFDVSEIRAALEEGAGRGASTISQQVVKNVLLWQRRSWIRKALEGLITPVLEAVWPKRRILEVYLNVIEFGEGVFGVDAASRRYFGIPASDLSVAQAANLAAVLPDPKGRSAADLSANLTRRAAAIADGAATIRSDGRDDCFSG